MSFCVSEPDRHLAQRIGRAAVKMIQEAGTAQDMITIDAELKFDTRPLQDCTGQKHMPDQFLSSDPIGISAEFRTYGRAAIGEVSPLF